MNITKSIKKIIAITLILALALTLSSCLNLGEPNYTDYSFINDRYNGTYIENPNYAATALLNSIVTEENWEKMFPERWGVGTHWEWVYKTYNSSFYNEKTMKYDLYSYQNFLAAVHELSYIQLKIEPVQWDYKAVYRKDSRTDKDWVYVCKSGSWTQENEVGTDPVIVSFVDFLSKSNASNTDHLRELAAFLANISHETGESDYDVTYAYALFYREEVGMEGTDRIGYIQADENFPAAMGRSYHGRGPIQLSYNYNYGQVSAFIFGNKDILLNNPELVMNNGQIAFMTAIWFWMFPQSPKPSCHEVMYSDYNPNSWGFGHSVMVINGGVEGGGAMKPRRGIFYAQFADILGTTIGGAGEELNTDNLTGYW